MPESNFERMIALAEQVFDTKNDAGQLDVNQEVLARLEEIHPATVSEFADDNGPAAWVLMIPCNLEQMHLFMEGKISEKELFESVKPEQKHEAIYLCSAMVLEEYRRKGIAKKLAVEAIESIRKEHDIQFLFVWAFSPEGLAGSEELSRLTGLPLLKKLK